MDALVEIITAPVQPWDALICTSNAVKDNVQRMLQSQVNYLQDRLGISKMVLPMLPVIPLGIHTQDFNFSIEQKAEARENLGVDQETLVVLFMGRLSFHAKAHPLAMYQALQNAALEVAKTRKKILLLECGWHANEFIQKAYQEAAKLACPDVKVMVLDGRVASAREMAWAGADVFCSLSDNIQETFGIVPIEAMAAGLPVVVSDWDGYKDTVRDGVDGFRIPTCLPEFGLASDLALRHALEIDTYDMYCGHTCSLVSVDIEAASKAFIKLFESPSLRRQMGEQGRMRAKQVFDWSNVIAQYESLWRELAQIRISAKSIRSKNLEHSWPARMDPFHAFASYPTNTLKPNSLLILVDASADLALKRLTQYKQLSMVNFAKLVLPNDEEIFLVLSVAQNGATNAENLLRNIEPVRKLFVFRSLVWFIKMGVLRLA
jgi:glycosyltransferase involved in cell wall biosynthesis